MARTTLTSKGRITIPQEVRTALGLEQGDQLVIEATEDGFHARVVRKPRAASLQGILRGAVAYEGEEAERAAVAEALARKHRLR
ncbi:AbrB/MazE/SpoVT family DNA-binding domain-containing protein [Deinococcus aetherius]|uniref:AbrB/MazE/SpoVT family DNA-binding domain-containing protein n=1 Tax=Deinococcus aetherius TaxID=200252 RepID=UPI0022318DED|nr:AbrB/MazE/SpoVT family DNA-binding domain-containing protein [Deinococcus aetherius]